MTAVRRKCATPSCLTFVPSDRTLCHWCRRTEELAEVGVLKECLRCRRSLPLSDFAGNGRYRVCDKCRDEHPMTTEERLRSHQMSPYYDLRTRRRRERRLRRAA